MAIPRKTWPVILGISIALFVFTIIKNAWVSDDAYITFRTIDNFANGHGLTWNPGHRVQSYTHPLWMMLNTIAYLFTGEIYFTTLFLSILLSSIAVFILANRIATSYSAGTLAVTILLFSHAFTDFATSGLENPLTSLCMAIFFWTYLRLDLRPNQKLLYLSTIASLGMLNRLDTALIFLPTLAIVFFPIRNIQAIKLIALGFVPLFVWEFFSIIYYGFPFPNTAYAKLNTGISTSMLLQQGLYYFHNSLTSDPLTLLAIFGGLAIPFILKEKQLLPIAIGVFAYLLYVLKIGGDFMTGRFFATPLLLSTILIAQLPLQKVTRTAPLFAIVLIIGLLIPNPPPLTTSAYGGDKTRPEFSNNTNGIVDERAYYFQGTGFLNVWSQGTPHHYFANHGRWLNQNQKHITFPLNEGTVGLLAYYAGPNIYLSDIYALTDPFLSRLPTENPKEWRIGHFQRRAPSGYLKTLETQKNHIANAGLAKLYDNLQLITRGELFTAKRWQAIWQANTGGYKTLVQPQWDVAYLRSQATELIQQERLQEAIVLLKEALQVDQTQPEIWYILAQHQYKTDQLHDAYESILQAIALARQGMEYRFLHVKIAHEFYAQGDTDQATLMFHEALQSAKISEVYLEVGQLLQNLGQTEWALGVFQDVVNHNMKTARYWYFATLPGAQKFQQEQKAQAFTHIAQILLQKGDEKNALYCYNQARRLDPQNQEANRYLTQKEHAAQ